MDACKILVTNEKYLSNKVKDAHDIAEIKPQTAATWPTTDHHTINIEGCEISLENLMSYIPF